MPSEGKAWFSSEHHHNLLPSMSSPAFIAHRCRCNPRSLHISRANTEHHSDPVLLRAGCLSMSGACACVLVRCLCLHICMLLFWGGGGLTNSNCGFPCEAGQLQTCQEINATRCPPFPHPPPDIKLPLLSFCSSLSFSSLPPPSFCLARSPY